MNKHGVAGRIRKFRLKWLLALFPAVLGLFIASGLVELGIIESRFSLHDVDTFIILSGLFMTTIIFSILISRESIRQMKRFSNQQAREEFAEEHARFLHRLDHEIKNPLMGIRTALDNLAETTDPAQRQHIRTEIGEQIDLLTRLVSDLRKVGDIERHEIERLPVDMLVLMKDAFSFVCEDAQASNRKLVLDLPSRLPPTCGDYDLLLLAVYNVLNNALKYTHAGDQITLKATSAEERIVISVCDTGAGISPEDLPYVWDELFRSKRVKNLCGSGIGLALVRRIIERHGGEVNITSKLQAGTTVQLFLPVLS